jgi:hypothetical protein
MIRGDYREPVNAATVTVRAVIAGRPLRPINSGSTRNGLGATLRIPNWAHNKTLEGSLTISLYGTAQPAHSGQRSNEVSARRLDVYPREAAGLAGGSRQSKRRVTLSSETAISAPLQRAVVQQPDASRST